METSTIKKAISMVLISLHCLIASASESLTVTQQIKIQPSRFKDNHQSLSSAKMKSFLAIFALVATALAAPVEEAAEIAARQSNACRLPTSSVPGAPAGAANIDGMSLSFSRSVLTEFLTRCLHLHGRLCLCRRPIL